MTLVVQGMNLQEVVQYDANGNPITPIADGGRTVSGGITKTISVTPTLSVGSGYATGDYVGTTGTPITFTDAARVNNGSGWVLGALLENNTAEAIAMELWIFDSTVTPPTDSAAWSISDADAAKCKGVLKFEAANWCQSALNAVCRSTSQVIPFVTGAASKDLFGCLVARGSLTGPVTVRLDVDQN